MNKKAQEVFGMSFGMIFSIIIIIAILGVGFFTIRHFLSLSKCSQVGLFLEDLQDEVDRAWTSGIYQGTFEGKLPSSGLSNLEIEKVCFGDLDDNAPNDRITQEELDNYQNPGDGFFTFLYPPENACGGDLFYKKLQHAETSGNKFFCVDVKNNIASIKLDKTPSDSLVKISE